MVDYYETNASFLSPGLKGELDRIEPEGLFPIQGEKGLYTLRVKDFGEKEILLHSLDDPVKEARDLIASYSLKEGDLPIVFGFGLAYHVMEVISALGLRTRIIVVDPNPHIFKMALRMKNLVALLSSPNIELIIGKDHEEALSRIGRMVGIDKLDRVRIIEHPQSILLNPSYYERLRTLLLNDLDIRRVNLEAFWVFAPMWATNIMENLQEIINNPPVESIFGRFQGIPVIIISAGPSLDGNIDKLKDVEERALLICVGSALRSCLARGIRPHLVVDVDARPQHLKKFEGIDLEGINIVADPIIYPPILKRFNATKFISTYGHPIMQWIQSHYEKRFNPTPLRTGGSASTVAFDLARRLEADPIIFIGLDLSFSGDRIYAQDTYTDQRLKRGYMMDSPTPLKDVKGRMVWSNRRMMLYKRWLEEEIAKTSSTCINASEAGILKEGVILMDLASVVDTYCNRRIDIDGILAEAASSLHAVNLDSLYHEMENLILGFSRLVSISEDAIRMIKKGKCWEEIAKINEEIDLIPASLLIKEVIEGVVWELKKRKTNLEGLVSLYEKIHKVSKRMESIMKAHIRKKSHFSDD